MITVFGATGFIGKALCRALIRKNIKLSLFARNEKRVPSDIARCATLHTGSIKEDNDIKKAIIGSELVINLITCYENIGKREELFETNINFPTRLAHICSIADVKKIIHTSTAGIFKADTKTINESSEINYESNDLYERTKAIGERCLVNKCHRMGLDLIVLRPTTVYGPEDYRLFKLFNMIKRKSFFFIGQGENYQNYIYIDDAVRAYIKAIDYIIKSCKSNIKIKLLCNIGTEPSVKLKDIFKIISKQLSVDFEPIKFPKWLFKVPTYICETICNRIHIKPPLYRGRINFYLESRKYNFKCAKEKLNYVTSVDFNEGVKKTISFYVNSGWFKK